MYVSKYEDIVYDHVNARLNFAMADFRKFCRGKMSWDIEDPSNLKNQLRKCPNCGLVWVRVEGCDGNTQCGARPTAQYSKDTVEGTSGMEVLSPFNYVVEIIWPGLEFIVQKLPNQRSQQSPTSFQSTNVSPLGCQQTFEWRSAPFISESELQGLRCFLVQVDQNEEEALALRTENSRRSFQEKNALSLKASFSKACKQSFNADDDVAPS